VDRIKPGQEQLAGVDVVLPHGLAGRVGVAGLDGVDDGGVVGAGELLPARHAVELEPELVRHEPPGRIGEPLEFGRVGDAVDGVVHLAVELERSRQGLVVQVVQLRVDLAQGFDVGRGGQLGGPRRLGSLGGGPHQVDVLDVAAAGGQHEETAVRLLDQPAVLGQKQQGLADRSDADAELFGDGPEAQNVARLDLPAQDEVADDGCDAVPQLFTPNPVRQLSHFRSVPSERLLGGTLAGSAHTSG
jgi:hypothetical protein